MKKLLILTALLCMVAPRMVYAEADKGSLRGSRSSMVRQNDIAREHDYSFLRTADQIDEFVKEGRLVHLDGSADYELANVSYPYVRAEVELFIRRLAREHRAACGDPLVVTSATRPLSEQPRNAHRLSVHPAGMAVDLRVSDNVECRSWLADALLALEKGSVLDVTREYRPPHFHVAVFPEAYAAYALPLEREDSLRAALEAARQVQPIATMTMASAAPLPRNSGDNGAGVNWWQIAAAGAGAIWVAGLILTQRRRTPNGRSRAA